MIGWLRRTWAEFADGFPEGMEEHRQQEREPTRKRPLWPAWPVWLRRRREQKRQREYERAVERLRAYNADPERTYAERLDEEEIERIARHGGWPRRHPSHD